MKRSVVALLLAALPAIAARRPGDPLHPGWNLFSRQDDIQLGQEAAQQILKKSAVVQDKFVQDYVARVGARLAAQPEAQASGFTFRFTVLNDPQVNAFALPGGQMFVYTGLLKVIDDEAELAGTMAHEMSHVILRHGTNQASKQAFLSIPAALASDATDDSMLGRLARIGIGFGENSYLLHFSRDHENEADALGARLMSEAGYNPLELARFFEKLQGSSGAQQSQLFSLLNDHPDPGNRRASITAEVATLPRRAYNFQSGEFNKLKPEVARLPPPPKPALPDINPLPEYRNVDTGTFSIQAPVDWVANEIENGITLAPDGGMLDNALAIGATLSYVKATGDLQRDTAALVTRLSLRTTSPPSSIEFGGRSALTTGLSGPSPSGGDEADILVTTETPRGLFYAVFVSPASKLEKAQPIFARMQRTLRLAP